MESESAWQYDAPEADAPTVEIPVVHRPVFVDSTGRRTRRAKAAAYVVATVCIAMLVMVGVSVAAGQRTPMLELPLLGGTANASAPSEGTVGLAGPAAAVGAADDAAGRPTGLLAVRKTPPTVRTRPAAPVSVKPQAPRPPVAPAPVVTPKPAPVVTPKPAPVVQPTTVPPVVPPKTTAPTPEGEPAPPTTTVPPTTPPPDTTTPETGPPSSGSSAV
jgi:outer membrane biosynthesis protein TonB